MTIVPASRLTHCIVAPDAGWSVGCIVRIRSYQEDYRDYILGSREDVRKMG